MRAFRHAAAIVAVVAVAVSPGVAVEAAPEYEVKAAFLLNFARFVEWPPHVLQTTQTFRICVVGVDPFGALLRDAVSGKSVHDRPVEIAYPDTAGELAGCHMAFVASSEVAELPRLLGTLSGSSVLTVGEAEHFARDGGMIQMRLEENKVRFEVNAEAAERVGLRVSSQLLKLATRVIQ